MEFFLPGLISIIIAATIAFAVLPRFSPFILAILSITLLVLGVYHHYSIFYHEYHYSTWQEKLKDYAPIIMIGVIILVSLFYMVFLFSSGSAPKNNSSNLNNIINFSNLPSANSATNPLTEIINNTIRTANDFAENIGIKNTGAKNKNGLLNTLNNSIVNTFSNVKSLIDGNEIAPANKV